MQDGQPHSQGPRQRVRRRRKQRRSKSLRKRVLSWMRRTLWPSFRTAPRSAIPSTKERLQVFGFILALLVAMIAAFVVIVLEDRSTQATQYENE